MNIHQRHVEDLILYQGSKGSKKALNILSQVVYGRADITEKADGAPAFIIGKEDGKLWVSLKNSSKEQYRFSDVESIQKSGYDLELIFKLVNLLLTFQKASIIDGVELQGDFMFMAMIPKLCGRLYQPNTLIYELPDDGKNYFIGVAFHTVKVNDEVKSIYDINSFITDIPDDVYLHDVTCDYTLTEKERLHLSFDIHFALDLWQNTCDDRLDEIANHKTAAKRIEGYYNHELRNPESNLTINEFIRDWHQKEANKRKTEAGKSTQIAIGEEIINLIDDPKGQRILRFRKQTELVKQKIINKLNKHTKKTVLVKTIEGKFISSNPEGYVVRYGGEAVKLINREEFSRINFSPDFVKGWNNQTRN